MEPLSSALPCGLPVACSSLKKSTVLSFPSSTHQTLKKRIEYAFRLRCLHSVPDSRRADLLALAFSQAELSLACRQLLLLRMVGLALPLFDGRLNPRRLLGCRQNCFRL